MVGGWGELKGDGNRREDKERLGKEKGRRGGKMERGGECRRVGRWIGI